MKDKVKAIYKATIFEYENGKTEVLYKCDKDNNKECLKVNCNKEY